MSATGLSGRSYSSWEIFCKTLIAADLKFSKSLAFSASGGPLRPIMKLLELSCHGIPWICFTLIVLYKTSDRAYEEVFFNLLLALILDLIIVGFTKVIFRRKRPEYNKNDMFGTVSVDNFSFPSGHATRAYLVTWFLLSHLKFALPVRILLQIWGHVVGFSRVFLGRHHITDVIAGFAIGYVEFLIIERYWASSRTCSYFLEFVK